jgi:RNA polymerase-binding transcription factor DksA
MAAAKKTGSAEKAAAERSAAPSSAAKKQAASTKSAPKKTASKKAASRKSAPKKTASKKAAPKKTAAKKAASTKSAPKKTAAKNASSKKAASTKKSAATKKTPPAKKTTATKKSTTRTPAARRRPTAEPRESASPMLSNERPSAVAIPKPRGTTKDGITYTKDFDVKFLKAQRDELEERRAAELARATRLEDEATSLIEDGEMGDVQFDDEGGEGDTMVVQRDLDRVLSSQARQTIAEIDAALERIRNGTYGYSEVSGAPIPRERLEAIPETTVLAAEKVSGIGRR